MFAYIADIPVIKKKTIAIALAAFILIPLFFSGSLQLFQLYLKQRADHRLANETLTDLSIPLHKVKWVEEGREIMVDGKMFDLKSFHEQDGFLIAKGVYDEKETKVMGVLKNFNDKEQTNFIIRLFLLAQTFVAIIYWFHSSILPAIVNSQFCFLIIRRSNPFHQKLYPPPRSVSHSPAL